MLTFEAFKQGFKRSEGADLFGKYSDLLSADSPARSAGDPVRVMLLGEFNAGKSSLANALLGQAVLPVDIFQTTATINRITHGAEVGFAIVDHAGNRVHRDSDLTRLADFNADCGAFGHIHWLEITHPGVPAGLEFIDTPGFNDPDPVRDQTFLSILPSVDVMVFVCDANQALKGSELPYIRKLFLGSLSRVRFVFNHSDTLRSFSKLEVVRNLATSQIRSMLSEAASLFETHDCRDLAQQISVQDPADFMFFTSAVAAASSGRAGMDPAFREHLLAEFSRLQAYLGGLTAQRQVLFQEWRLHQGLGKLEAAQSETQTSLQTIEAMKRDRTSLQTALEERLKRQLDAAKAYRDVCQNLPRRIDDEIRSETERFLKQFGDTLESIGDDINTSYLAERYQRDIQGFVQKLNERIQNRLQADLKLFQGPLIDLETHDMTLKAKGLPSHARRQQEYAQHMAGSAIGSVIGAGIGFLLLGGLPGIGIGAAIGGQLSNTAGQASAMRAQRQRLDQAYQEILGEARQLLDRVRRDLTPAIEKLVHQFQREWLEGATSAQWQVLELSALGSEDAEKARSRLVSREKQIQCAIREFRIAVAALRSQS